MPLGIFETLVVTANYEVKVNNSADVIDIIIHNYQGIEESIDWVKENIINSSEQPYVNKEYIIFFKYINKRIIIFFKKPDEFQFQILFDPTHHDITYNKTQIIAQISQKLGPFPQVVGGVGRKNKKSRKCRKCSKSKSRKSKKCKSRKSKCIK